MSLSPEALDNVLNQFVDFFIRMFTLELPRGGQFYGSLRVTEMEGRREVVPGPVLEETLWQLYVAEALIRIVTAPGDLF